VSFLVYLNHGAPSEILKRSVVYCTSTTGFNISFIPSREFASKALPLPLSGILEDTQHFVARIITFLAPFHSRNEFFSCGLLLLIA
jgi:hypothetical protein